MTDGNRSDGPSAPGGGGGGGGGGGPSGGKRRRRRRRGGGGGGPKGPDDQRAGEPGQAAPVAGGRQGQPQRQGHQGQGSGPSGPSGKGEGGRGGPQRSGRPQGQGQGGGRGDRQGRGRDKGARGRGGQGGQGGGDRLPEPDVRNDLRIPRGNERPEAPFKHVTKRYGVAVFDTFMQAKSDLDALAAKAAEVDQLNVVIRAEGNMDDPDLTKIANVKVFAGTAWALIHDRRIADGWYESPR